MFALKAIRLKYLHKTFQQKRPLQITQINFSKPDLKFGVPQFENERLSELFEKYKDKVIYNTYADSVTFKRFYTPRGTKLYKQVIRKEKNDLSKIQSVEPLPVVLKYINESVQKDEGSDIEVVQQKSDLVNFPYGNENAISVFGNEDKSVEENSNDEEENQADITYKEIKDRKELYKDVDFSKWMLDYENYEGCEGEEDEVGDRWKINYGTPDPNSRISNVACGGCGALLHCKDTAIPGYLPSEIYKNSFKREGTNLQSLICQRCYFLKNYDLALQVRVTPEDYPKILETIKEKRGLIVLMVDLLDFPCSVWPGLGDTLGSNKPIIVVGNKVDLLPRDSRGYLDRIKNTLKTNVESVLGESAKRKLKHVALISAKTGWGVEELITKLHNLWEVKGNVYLVGCTNVGKSSLFNCLLQSDFCKVQAVDLVQRATTSLWPGTTLNLLKFPILRPSGWRLFVRTKRLQSVRQMQAQEEKLNKIQWQMAKDPKYVTLMGHLDRTFIPESSLASSKDPFSVRGNPLSSGKLKLGINEKERTYALSKWCYDTPGVVQPDQIIHLLTTEELMLTLPKHLLRPQTFSIRVGQTLFIGGIARLDCIDGPKYVRLTVFRSDSLPITMCLTEDADLLYKKFLGTEMFQVPKGSTERLNKWPDLKAAINNFKLTGESRSRSSGDIVLSNAGWVAVTCERGCEVNFKAWTPEARGIHLRESVLPDAVALKGKRIRRTPTYDSERIYVPP